MFGFINLNKPPGLTSREAVDQIKKRAFASLKPGRQRLKLGHAGTLDPLAEGVLVVALGPATRLISFVQQAKKKYLAEFQLGVTSDSLDLETELIKVDTAGHPTKQDVIRQMDALTGVLDQVPPVYSAAKVEGKRAYRLARRGVEFDLKPKKVEVEEFTLEEFNFPYVTASIRCGAGTYIRSLGRDLGIGLGSGAVMTRLTRMAVGNFDLKKSVNPLELDSEHWRRCVISPEACLEEFPAVLLDESQVDQIRHGTLLPLQFDESMLRGLDQQGRLMAVLKKSAAGFRPMINFVSYHDRQNLESLDF